MICSMVSISLITSTHSVYVCFTFFHIPLMIKYIYLILIMITPIVKSVNVKEYDFKQSKDE